MTWMYVKDTNFIFGMPQIYTCKDTQTPAHTSAETPAHTDTDTCTKTYISTHADIHKHTCIFLTHLAYMPVSLCNHDLSIMCHCHHYWCNCCCHHHHHCCHWCCMCTAIPVRTLITEMLYLADLCTCIPSICTWNIG